MRFFGNRSLNVYAWPMKNEWEREKSNKIGERQRETTEGDSERKQIKPCSIREKTTQISQRVHRLAYLMKLIKT